MGGTTQPVSSPARRKYVKGKKMTKEQAENLKKQIDENYQGMKAFVFAVLDHEGRCQVNMHGNMFEMCFLEKSFSLAILNIIKGDQPSK
jgi:5'-3' exonuclease